MRPHIAPARMQTVRFYLTQLDQMLPPENEAPILHAGVTKLRALVRELEEDDFG